jgi:hypothetical protein
MPNLLIRNLPADLHARLKAAAEAHRRSVNQETIAIIDEKLGAGAAKTIPPRLPEPIKPRRPITMEETLRYIDEGQR